MTPRRKMRGERPDPILVPCEGSGHPTHYLPLAILAGAPCGHICAMCGEGVVVDPDGTARPHQRKDIIAMINRGDLG